ncbi:hypothetical protein DBW36_001737 [Escherichia coli]|nr:hypothetical protein [Escherichia coli]EFG5951042.1 hypothetical protein [Escherichia coli]EGI3080552.1 hypothetical protein [Escherichia coli]EGL8709910.1 hypothetical protein [Escherichia coli]EHD1141013.1 hypothetical protein [Escherichia coli]
MFPAPAGINRLKVVADTPVTSVPRASGDKPCIASQNGRVRECSPRQRG